MLNAILKDIWIKLSRNEEDEYEMDGEGYGVWSSHFELWGLKFP